MYACTQLQQGQERVRLSEQESFLTQACWGSFSLGFLLLGRSFLGGNDVRVLIFALLGVVCVHLRVLAVVIFVVLVVIRAAPTFALALAPTIFEPISDRARDRPGLWCMQVWQTLLLDLLGVLSDGLCGRGEAVLLLKLFGHVLARLPHLLIASALLQSLCQGFRSKLRKLRHRHPTAILGHDLGVVGLIEPARSHDSRNARSQGCCHSAGTTMVDRHGTSGEEPLVRCGRGEENVLGSVLL
mmetsp:Transcript_92103/g.201862  ORF Transcript_92103/g.201862 Transcript_92103/m.201862 type:complete len:242 (+) Transcript_92103:10-735(+)